MSESSIPSPDAWMAVLDAFIDPDDPENNQGFEDLHSLAQYVDQNPRSKGLTY